MLKVEKVAQHFGLTPATVRRRIKSGDIYACRINREYRLAWRDVWACEMGPPPHRNSQKRYEERLIDKSKVARACDVCIKTVERWIDDGLWTRNVFGSVRMNPWDVQEWLERRIGIQVSIEELRRDEE
jgi:predicted site-specific integrase-resolvase